MGHPLLGDGKYGKTETKYDRKYQALYAYRLTFDFTTDAGVLNYLGGKSFRAEFTEALRQVRAQTAEKPPVFKNGTASNAANKTPIFSFFAAML